MAVSSGGAARRVLLTLLLLAGYGAAGGARAAPPVTDSMAQRVRACAACHGGQGGASAEGYVPRIAGKPAVYLHQQLLAFRDGRRRHDGMARLLEHLSDAYLAEMAAHFAALNLPYAPVNAGRSTAAPQQLLRGQMLATQGDASLQLPACNACHGSSLMGVQPAVPGLLGLPKDYVLSQLGRWRLGVRQAREPDCMAQIAQRLAPTDMAAVAAWLQSQIVPANPAPQQQAPLSWPLACGSWR